MKRIWLLTIFQFFLAWAHELWIERKGEEYVLLYGHLKPDKGESSQLTYTPDKVLSFECLDADGRKLSAEVVSEYPVRLRGRCQVLEATFSTGFWTKTPEGLKNVPRTEVKNSIESWYSVERVRRLNIWTFRQAPLTDDLELLLVDNPSDLKPGQKFTVIAFYRNRPLKDAPISHNGRLVGSTDGDGRINLRLRERGIQLIGVSIREKNQSVRADHTLKTFYLMFEAGR